MHRNSVEYGPAAGRQHATCEHGKMKGTASVLHAARLGAVNSAVSQDCSVRNSQDCGLGLLGK